MPVPLASFCSEGLPNLISAARAPDIKNKDGERWLAVIESNDVPEEIPRRVLLLDCVSVP